MSVRRHLALAAVIVLACLGGMIGSATAETEPIQQQGTIRCGYERWLVKTGQDVGAAQVNMTAQKTTIAAMGLVPSPLPSHSGKYPPQVNKRLAGEFQEVTVSATLIEYRVEADSDIHVVLTDGAQTLITEIPNPACMGHSPWKAAVTIARRTFLRKTRYKPVAWTKGYGPPFVKSNLPVLVTGVEFFDWPHSQNGAATNAVEIHPILGISFP